MKYGRRKYPNLVKGWIIFKKSIHKDIFSNQVQNLPFKSSYRLKKGKAERFLVLCQIMRSGNQDKFQFRCPT